MNLLLSPSPSSDAGAGRVEERRCVRLPLSSVLSPLLRRGEGKKKGAPNNLRKLRELSESDTNRVLAEHTNDVNGQRNSRLIYPCFPGNTWIWFGVHSC